MLATSPIPSISISFAEEQNAPESVEVHVVDDGFRPKHLTPPPTHSPRFQRQHSPLRPAECVASNGKGLERAQFEALLKRAGKKPADLRKEIAIKVHKGKQIERRALFLSKILAPPSPTAASTPKTPPESPSVFHYTLPSPSLESPLAFFESQKPTNVPWVEQVDYRVPHTKPRSKPAKALPSLAEIAARIGKAQPAAESVVRSVRLPSFLAKKAVNVPTTPTIVVTPTECPVVSRPRLAIGSVGRLNMPIRAAPEPRVVAPPPSPNPVPNIVVTTTLVPRTASNTSPTKITAVTLQALDSRARTRKDLISTLKRRTSLEMDRSEPVDEQKELQERRLRRISAPAELQHRGERSGFGNPVLKRPGAF